MSIHRCHVFGDRGGGHALHCPAMRLEAGMLLAGGLRHQRQFKIVAAKIEQLKDSTLCARVYMSIGNTAWADYMDEVASSLKYDSCPIRSSSGEKLVCHTGDTIRLAQIGFQHGQLKVVSHSLGWM